MLTWRLCQLGPLDIGALVRVLADDGFTVSGRPSKTVSDALRWEVRRGRIVRLARGRYAPGRMPRGTAHRIRRRVEAIEADEISSAWRC